MLARRIIPCLDVSHGRVVKGIRFQGLRDAGDPAERAALYEEQGADEIVILDVSATPEGRGNQVETVRRVRARLGIPLTVGGGVRNADDARALLEAGADKVSVNTAAVQRPDLLGQIAERFGRQCTVLAIDAARRDGRLEVLVKGGREGTGMDAVAWARDGTARGAGEILLDQLGPGRHAGGLRPRPHPGDRRRGPRAGDRLGRRRGRGAPEASLRCRRGRRARGVDLPRRRADRGRRQAGAPGPRRADPPVTARRRRGPVFGPTSPRRRSLPPGLDPPPEADRRHEPTAVWLRVPGIGEARGALEGTGRQHAPAVDDDEGRNRMLTIILSSHARWSMRPWESAGCRKWPNVRSPRVAWTSEHGQIGGRGLTRC